MSKNNGDKARFGKERKKKLLRRKRNLALRQSLSSNTVMLGNDTKVAAPSQITQSE